MKIIHCILTLIQVFSALSEIALFKKVLLQDKTALCLDGSPGAYYIYQGKSLTKFMLYFQGGGWCGDKDLPSTIQNCYQRSLDHLGSTKKLPDNYTLTDGILSANPLNSFNDFTKIEFRYCDGSGHQGTRSSPIKYKDIELYFRGSNITIATFQQIQKKYKVFSNATEILVTGNSAGGLAAFTWVDYIRNRSTTKNVYAAIDSGIFLDSPNFNTKQHQYRNMFMNLFKLSNTEIQPPVPECVAEFKDQSYLCMLAQNLHQFIKTPFFTIQSLYDSWSIPNILGIKCAKNRSLKDCNTEQMGFIEEYHKNTSRVLEQIGADPNHGYWAPACVDHTYVQKMFYSPDYEVPMHSDNTIDNTLFAWSQKQSGNHQYMDRGNWPQNQPCSGVFSSKLRME